MAKPTTWKKYTLVVTQGLSREAKGKHAGLSIERVNNAKAALESGLRCTHPGPCRFPFGASSKIAKGGTPCDQGYTVIVSEEGEE